MTGGIIINRDGQLLDVGVGLDGPIPRPLMQVLTRDLQYTHMRRRSWDEMRDPATGERRSKYAFEPKKLYLVDGRDRLVCQAGFAARIEREAAALGIPCDRHWVIYPQMRPGRFRQDWENLFRNFEFRPKQLEMVEAIASSEGGVVVVPTGVGKGYLAAALALLYPDDRFILTTVSAAVAHSDRAVLAKYLPEVGMVGDGHKHEARVTVWITKSLCGRAGSVDCDWLIGDEAHELGAETYAEAVSMAGRYARPLGLTASPEGRADGADMMLEALFGPVLYRMTYPEAVEHGLVVPIVVSWFDVVLPRNPVANIKDDVERQRHGIWQNQGRNAVIAAAANLHGPDEQVLIMVSTVEHALFLGALLPGFALCFANIEAEEEQIWEKAGLVDTSRISRSGRDRDALRKAFETGESKKVIATGVWSRGVSFDGLSVMIRADGRSGEIAGTQIPGRVSRRHDASGKQVGLVYDFRDLWDTGFKASSAKRSAVYKKHGWQQVRVQGVGAST